MRSILIKGLLHAAWLAIAVGLGLWIGMRWSQTSTPTENSPEGKPSDAAWHEPASGIVGRPGPGRPDGPPPLSLVRQLSEDLSRSTGELRWLHWMDALERATPADFPRLLQLADANSTALKLVASRWMERDPQSLFDHLAAHGFVQHEVARLLFRRWMERDPEAAIQALETGTPDSHQGMSPRWLRFEVVNQLMQQDPERGFEILSRWNIVNHGPSMNAVKDWSRTDPRRAAQVVLDHPSGYGSRLGLETIGEVWATEDPAAALAFATSQTGHLPTILARSAIKAWAKHDAAAAADWLVSTSPSVRSRLSPDLLEAWAGQDLAAAVEWSQSQLTGAALTRAIEGLVRGAAEQDPAQAAALVSDMVDSPERATAAAAVVQKWIPEFGTPHARIPDETVAWLRSLDGQSRVRAVESVFSDWARVDVAGLVRFLGETQDSLLPDDYYGQLARRLVRRDPVEALAWADALPGTARQVAGAQAFAEWRSAQPEPAQKWFRELPTDDPRRRPYLQAAVEQLAYSPLGPDLLTPFTDGERAMIRDLLSTTSLPEDKRQKLLEALPNPTEPAP